MISRLPVIGYVLRLLNEERVGELGFFVLNLALLATVATLIFGWPAFITFMLAVTALALTALVGATLAK